MVTSYILSPPKVHVVALPSYMKKSFDCKVLSDLNALEDEFETLWVEINTGSECKNIVICCAYRHPDTDASKFIEHFEHILSKIDKNKVLCILGDFNCMLKSVCIKSSCTKTHSKRQKNLRNLKNIAFIEFLEFF